MKRSSLTISIILAIILVSNTSIARIKPGIEQLHRLDLLPQFKQSVKVASISSHDRSGGNDDGFSGAHSFVRKEPDGLVIADLKGPGVIYRIWTPTPTDDIMEFYFDGETKPKISVKFRDLFTGTNFPFVRPIVGFGAGGFYSYLPLPYEKSCKIVMKAQRVQFYQINYAVYPDNMQIESFSMTPSKQYLEHLDKAKALFASAGKDISSYTAGDEAKIKSYKKDVSLKPASSATVFEIKRPGRIVGMRFSPAGVFKSKDRDIIIKGYFDNDKKPAILSPAGDFFGYAWGSPAMKSLMVGTSGDADYCYYPMPFDKSAKIQLVSERKQGTLDIKVEVLVAPAQRSQDEGKFYALWRRENPTTKGKPFTFIETKGKGHIVGCIQQSQGFESGNTYYFEGDDQTTIDGQLLIHGTGSEDFYNGGWYDVPGRWETKRSFPLSGCLGYYKHLGRTGGYRLMIGDAYAYEKSILQTIEHAPTENSLLNDYCAVTYLYSKERPTCDFKIPDLAERKVFDLKKIVFAPSWGVPIYAFSFEDASVVKGKEKLEGADQQYISFQSTKENQWWGYPFIGFICEVPSTGQYRVSIDAIKGPGQAKVQLFMDEAPIGKEHDLYSEKREKATNLELAQMNLIEGRNILFFKLTGKNEKSTALALDLIRIICEKIE